MENSQSLEDQKWKIWLVTDCYWTDPPVVVTLDAFEQRTMPERYTNTRVSGAASFSPIFPVEEPPLVFESAEVALLFHFCFENIT